MQRLCRHHRHIWVRLLSIIYLACFLIIFIILVLILTTSHEISICFDFFVGVDWLLVFFFIFIISLYLTTISVEVLLKDLLSFGVRPIIQLFIVSPSKHQLEFKWKILYWFFVMEEILNCVLPLATLHPAAVKFLTEWPSIDLVQCDQGPSYLDVGWCPLILDLNWLTNQFESSKFRIVIRHGNRTIDIHGQVTMMSTHTDVCDSDLSDLGSTHLDAWSSVEIDHMDCLGSGLSNWLNYHIVVRALMDHVI